MMIHTEQNVFRLVKKAHEMTAHIILTLVPETKTKGGRKRNVNQISMPHLRR